MKLWMVALLCCTAMLAQAPDRPLSANVNGIPWKIEWWPKTIPGKSDYFVGYTFCGQQRIGISEEAKDQRETVMHEVMHAATCHDGDVHNKYWNSQDEEHHTGIDRIANFWLHFLRDNPSVAAWLLAR